MALPFIPQHEGLRVFDAGITLNGRENISQLGHGNTVTPNTCGVAPKSPWIKGSRRNDAAIWPQHRPRLCLHMCGLNVVNLLVNQQPLVSSTATSCSTASSNCCASSAGRSCTPASVPTTTGRSTSLSLPNLSWPRPGHSSRPSSKHLRHKTRVRGGGLVMERDMPSA